MSIEFGNAIDWIVSVTRGNIYSTEVLTVQCLAVERSLNRRFGVHTGRSKSLIPSRWLVKRNWQRLKSRQRLDFLSSTLAKLLRCWGVNRVLELQFACIRSEASSGANCSCRCRCHITQETLEWTQAQVDNEVGIEPLTTHMWNESGKLPVGPKDNMRGDSSHLPLLHKEVVLRLIVIRGGS